MIRIFKMGRESGESEKKLFVEGIGEVLLVRKARSRQIRIAVKSSGNVLVSIPWQLSFSRGEAFLEEKKEWVMKALQKIEKSGPHKSLLQPGILFSTRSLKYMLAPGKTDRVKVHLRQEDQTVVFGFPEDASLQDPDIQNRIRLALLGVLRYEAKRYLPGRTKVLAGQMGYPVNTVTIKNNKTNWGSCSNLKNINLNLHLMRLPDRLIDFIIVHELVHTRIPNHGPSFKAQLRSHFPDADILEKEIKKFRPELF